MTFSRREFVQRSALVAAGAAVTTMGPGATAAASESPLRFAIIGDYGSALPAERQVADLVASWNPSYVATLGDNVYSGDGADPYTVLTQKVGAYYGNFVSSGNFFPALGNHDWGDPGTPLLSCSGGSCSGAWLDYFNLPGNGRYYSVRRGPVELFVLDDYYLEPDGHTANSAQAQWLRRTAAASTARWKIVVHHFPAYSSRGGGQASIRWPFAQWGIHAVFAGHHHVYERLERNGIPYVVNGLGGARRGGLGVSNAPNVRARYAANYGANRITATSTGLTIEFVDVNGNVVDSTTLGQQAQRPTPPPTRKPQPGRRQRPAGAPATKINWPQANWTFDGRIKLTGWATAPTGVSHVALVVKDRNRNLYWNGSAFATKPRTFRGEVDSSGQPSTGWSHIIPGPPPGSYQARAWARTAEGTGDPIGSTLAVFDVR